MIHSSGALAPGMRAITSYSGFRLQSDLTRRCTLAGPGPTWYVMPSPPRHSWGAIGPVDRKSTRLNSSHSQISYAVFCLKKKNKHIVDSDITREKCISRLQPA